MDDSEQSKAVLALGRKLVSELGLEPSVDTLGRWMAHYLAELMNKCEAQGVDNKERAQRECFDSILAIWSHSHELPDGKRPFEEIEPVVRAVASLDPEDDSPRYFRWHRPPHEADAEESETETWLKLADGLDHSAKLLIGYCLKQAVAHSGDKSEEWVELAKAAGFDQTAPEIVISFVSREDEHDEEQDKKGRLRSQLEGRLERVESFLNLSDFLVQDLRSQLDELTSDLEESEGGTGVTTGT